MDYCQKQYLIPNYIENEKILFMCPFGKSYVPIFNDLNIDLSEITPKVESAVLKECKKCPMCDTMRNNQDIIDSVMYCVKNTYSELINRKVTNPTVANYIGKSLDQFVWMAHYMKQRD